MNISGTHKELRKFMRPAEPQPVTVVLHVTLPELSAPIRDEAAPQAAYAESCNRDREELQRQVEAAGQREHELRIELARCEAESKHWIELHQQIQFKYNDLYNQFKNTSAERYGLIDERDIAEKRVAELEKEIERLRGSAIVPETETWPPSGPIGEAAHPTDDDCVLADGSSLPDSPVVAPEPPIPPVDDVAPPKAPETPENGIESQNTLIWWRCEKCGNELSGHNNPSTVGSQHYVPHGLDICEGQFKLKAEAAPQDAILHESGSPSLLDAGKTEHSTAISNGNAPYDPDWQNADGSLKPLSKLDVQMLSDDQQRARQRQIWREKKAQQAAGKSKGKPGRPPMVPRAELESKHNPPNGTLTPAQIDNLTPLQAAAYRTSRNGHAAAAVAVDADEPEIEVPDDFFEQRRRANERKGKLS